MSSSRPTFLAAHGVGLTLPGGRVLFRDLSLSLGSERTALVGPNGVGKSLLLEILVGLRAPTRGGVVRSGSVGYVPQAPDPSARRLPPGVPDEGGDGRDASTVAGALGLTRRLARLERVLGGRGSPSDVDAVGGDWDLRERVDAVLDRFGLGHLALERPIASLSGGEATRVRLVRPVLDSPRILVLDEPTNDLDGESRAALASFLEAWDGGLLVVSHDRTLLEGVDRIVELSTLGLREYGGGWALYREARDRERAAARAELDQARAARRRTEEAVREERERRARRQARGRRSRATGSQPPVVLEGRRERSEGTARRGGETEERLLTSAAAREAEARARLEERDALRVELDPTGLPARKEVLRMEGVAYAPPGVSDLLLEGVTLRLRGPERVSVTGPNGSGKTTLLRLAMGLLEPRRGSVALGLEPREVAYLDQRASVLGRERTVLEAFRSAHPELPESRARHALARFLFPDHAALAPVDTLSGGERMRAALACVVGGPRPPAFLLLDEPTNHLDLESLETVEEAVSAYDGALLVVSHDPRFLEVVGVERTLGLG